jgi:hypothetical protein
VGAERCRKTGKLSYRTRQAAGAAHDRIARYYADRDRARGATRQARPYLCHSCGAWHLGHIKTRTLPVPAEAGEAIDHALATIGEVS